MKKYCLLLIIATWCAAVHSQVMPPPAHSNSPYYVPPGAQSGNGVSIPSIRWVDRWGAIAVDFNNRSMGASVDEATKKKATNSALKKCREAGGANCKIELAYYNQCAAMVTGAVGYIAARAETEGRAGEIGMNMCKEKDKNCSVFYSACSLPVQAE